MEINIEGFPVLFTREGISLQPRHIQHLANARLSSVLRAALMVHPEYVAYMLASDKNKSYAPGIAPEGCEYLHQQITAIFQQKNQAMLERQVIATPKTDWRADSLRRRIEERERDRSGFVYLLKTETGRYKIGRTNNPERRRTDFVKALSVECELLCVIACKNMWHTEEELHYKFHTKRLEGEWFNLLPEDIEYIKSMVVQS